MNQTKLREELHQSIDQWMKVDPETRSIAYLAREANVNESTVRRLYNVGKVPSGENLFKIVSCISGGQTVENVLLSTSEEVRNHLRENFSFLNWLEASKATTVFNLEPVLTDFSLYLVFKLASNANKTTRPVILEQFGTQGAIALNALIDRELVKESADGTISLSNPVEEFSLSCELTKDHASRLISEFYKPSSEVNYLVSSSESVSSVGYSKIMDTLEKAAHDISAIKKEHPGSIPMFAVMALDTMTYDNHFEKQTKKGNS